MSESAFIHTYTSILFLHTSYMYVCVIYLTAIRLTPGGCSTHLHTNSTQYTEQHSEAESQNGTYIIIIIIIIIITISFMQGIYTYIPETNNVPKQYNYYYYYYYYY
jgi:hypothetical protein